MSPAEPAGLHAAMRSFADAETREHIVHHHGAGLNLAREGFTSSAVASPDAGGQTIIGIVGQTDHFGIVVEGCDRQHRAEGLFAHHAHVVVHVGQHGGSEECWAQVAQACAAHQQASAMRARIRNM